jgi:hypothetical protein
MKSKAFLSSIIFAMILLNTNTLCAQSTNADSAWKKSYKNIIRYNLSGALLFGFDNYVIFGYERMINPHQSFSINIGGVALPKFVSVNTDSFSLQKDVKNTGFNLSVDYRFYLPHENKYEAPRGVYIGPYFSYNHFDRSNDWVFEESGAEQKPVTTTTNFSIYTVGGELGYQFVFWRRLALDLVLIGPGISGYHLKSKIDGDLTEAEKANLQDALKQLITQKFPGMNYVFADKEFNGNGVINTTSIGFRYMVHVGFRF